jgi:phosphodiesterase/alkaline phosphatase D-like protein
VGDTKEGYVIRAEIPVAIAGRLLKGPDEVLRIERGVDRPLAVMLLPMMADADGQFCVAINGQPVRQPQAADVPGKITLITEPPGVNELFLLPPLSWPGSAERALLLVFYEGPFDVGAVQIDKNPPPELKLETIDSTQATSVGLDFGIREAVARYFTVEPDGIAPERAGLIRQGRPAKEARQRPENPSSVEPRTFALASCQYPGGLLDRSLRPDARSKYVTGLSDRSWFCLSQIAEAPMPDLLIIAGDQVYVDATAGLFDPETMDDAVRGAYKSLRRNRGYSTLFNNFVTRVSMIDDHEIEDDWEPLPGQDPKDPRPPLNAKLLDGGRSYLNEVRRQPTGEIKKKYELGMPLAFQFKHGEHEFFMADTRTRRDGRNAENLLDARIMDEEQWSELTKWIANRTDGVPAFVITPSMLLPRQLTVARGWPMASLHSDAWDGYPHSLCEMLALLCEEGRGNIIFLSGDAHTSCAARITVQQVEPAGNTVTVHSVHSSALYAPYPFANAVEEDFARADEFDFSSPFEGGNRRFQCAVKTFFPHVDGKPIGDGFALITTQKREGQWTVEVSFRSERASCPCRLYPSPPVPTKT